ncbi:MAG: NAD(P)-dependent dehydrogenase (short-subunit alcohol dehydrogenase family) [Candidatus Azotimanducaceae bacterium]|jgi:NAD(P)-dependent dehydrogenase (short-subunit alcohol dehydrogenase family)
MVATTSTDKLAGKVALVTGAAMGIGAACATALAAAGARVVLTDVGDEAGADTVASIIASGGNASYFHHDVTSEAEWEALIAAIEREYGSLDILVNNAGIAIVAPITEMTLKDFHKQNAVNLDGVFLGLKHSIPLIAASGGGSIINLSSVAGLKASPNLSAYAMTKGGVRLLSKSVGKECAQAGNNIRVNSIHPGIIETAIWDKMGLSGEDGANRAEAREVAANSVPGGILGQPMDIANGVVFLASDDSSYMNASELVIDHGYSA